MNEILVYNMYFIAQIGFTQIFLIKDVYITTLALLFLLVKLSGGSSMWEQRTCILHADCRITDRWSATSHRHLTASG